MISITKLEKYGYVIDYNTNRDWVVTTPEGKTLLLQKYIGMCEGMPYLDIRGNHGAFVTIQTVHEKFGMSTEKKVEKAIKSREIQASMDHPKNEKLKQLVSSKSIYKCSVVAIDVTNARTLFGPNRLSLRGETVQQRPERVITEYLDIPQDYY